jgi:hypothetical protein
MISKSSNSAPVDVCTEIVARRRRPYRRGSGRSHRWHRPASFPFTRRARYARVTESPQVARRRLGAFMLIRAGTSASGDPMAPVVLECLMIFARSDCAMNAYPSPSARHAWPNSSPSADPARSRRSRFRLGQPDTRRPHLARSSPYHWRSHRRGERAGVLPAAGGPPARRRAEVVSEDDLVRPRSRIAWLSRRSRRRRRHGGIPLPGCHWRARWRH